MITGWLLRRARRVMRWRDPDFVIRTGSIGSKPYLKRWWIIPRNRWFNIYLHVILRSDDDRALHDHPWCNLSVILDGQYTEQTILAGGVHRRIVRRAGDWKFRRSIAAHRLEVDRPCVTLFITGPVLRTWGFHCPGGWRPWREFTDARDKGSIGPGCD